MKKHFFALLAAAALVLPNLAAEENTRTIHLVQDDAQVKMTTKIYNLKHLKATDIVSFVNVAARRYALNSQVRALNFRANNQQSLIVTTAEEFMPYMDQIIETLDRGTKKNEFDSAVYGIGYKWKVYYPKYRRPEDLITPANVMLSGNGNVYAYNGTLWVKDDMDDVDYALDWVKYFDRPVPQANVTLRYYSVRESTLRDIGIDYLAWKNGPGMNLLDFAFSSGRIAWDRVFNTAMNLAGSSAFGWAYGGIFTAPAFDMSFVRLLQQSGEAKILASASINVVSDQDVASIALTPTYNAIYKNPENHAASVKPIALTDMMVHVYKPTICFYAEQTEISDMGWIPTTPDFYAKNKGNMIFGYDLTSTDPVEANNYGHQIGNNGFTSSSFNIVEFGHEQILANAVREFDVEQTTGIPFLCQIPVLKYIFGTTTTLKEKDYIFVTIEVNLAHPETMAAK